MATIQREPQTVEVLPPAVVGVDLTDPHKRTIAAAEALAKFKRSGKVRIIQSGETDFEQLGKDSATLVLETKGEADQQINEIRKYQRLTVGMIWLAAAIEVSKASDPVKASSTVVSAFKTALEAKGHKRAGVDASEFKCFMAAYLISPDEVMGVLDESGTQADAMKVLREIRDTGKVTKAKTKTKTVRAPSDKTMGKVLEAIGRMNTQQLTLIFKAGQSRAKVLRKAGELFEAFK